MPQKTSCAPATRKVLVHGLPYFGKMFAELMTGDGWDFRYFPDEKLKNLAGMARSLWSCDLVYQIGGRVTLGKFLWAARCLEKEKVVMHWTGSDTLDERRDAIAGRSAPWVTKKLHHWAASDWMVREVRNLGLECELVPLPSSQIPQQPSAPAEEFSVLVYMPDVRRGPLYGLDRILQVAADLPHIPFDLVGLVHGPLPVTPRNLRVHGRLPNLLEFYRRAPVVWRPVRHDGLSFMVLEALGHGRHVLWTYDFPGCLPVATAEQAREEISRLHSLHQRGRLAVNHTGAREIARNYLPQCLRRMIHQRLEDVLDS